MHSHFRIKLFCKHKAICHKCMGSNNLFSKINLCICQLKVHISSQMRIWVVNSHTTNRFQIIFSNKCKIKINKFNFRDKFEVSQSIVLSVSIVMSIFQHIKWDLIYTQNTIHFLNFCLKKWIEYIFLLI